VKNGILSFLGAQLIRLLRATLRVRHIRAENVERLPQYVIAFWHDHLLLMLHARYRKPIVVLSSRSRDGDLMVRLYAWYGVQSVRGSSTRGATGALRGIIRAARGGSNIVFTPDGPRGPARVAKDGVVFAARATGLPIVPIAFAAKKKSYCTHGTGWSSPRHSLARSSSMATRSSCRVTATLKSGGSGWRTQ
jgi:lysophospholipid acyltransferase (LPLAT)-like uncharacterized protein